MRGPWNFSQDLYRPWILTLNIDYCIIQGAVHLLEAVEVMVNNDQAVPVSITLAGGVAAAAVSRDSPLLTLSVTDLKVSITPLKLSPSPSPWLGAQLRQLSAETRPFSPSPSQILRSVSPL
jgi:hypothetical protein